MVRSLFNETKQCALPINPAHYLGRFAYKSVWFSLTVLSLIMLILRSVTCSRSLLELAPILQLIPWLKRCWRWQWISWISLVMSFFHIDFLSNFLSLGSWSNIIDFIEPLQWIPTLTRSRGRKLHDDIIEVYGAMILRVKARLDAGEDVPDCLAKTLIQTREEEGLDWEDMCMLAAVFTLGGVHSVSVSPI